MTLIQPLIVEYIYDAKRKMPKSWKVHTDETDFYIILHIPMKEFESYSFDDRIKIAEATNELCQRIKETGIPCYIEKV